MRSRKDTPQLDFPIFDRRIDEIFLVLIYISSLNFLRRKNEGKDKYQNKSDKFVRSYKLVTFILIKEPLKNASRSRFSEVP